MPDQVIFGAKFFELLEKTGVLDTVSPDFGNLHGVQDTLSISLKQPPMSFTLTFNCPNLDQQSSPFPAVFPSPFPFPAYPISLNPYRSLKRPHRRMA